MRRAARSHCDNNHAWPALLDANGVAIGKGDARGIAAKVYRKTYSMQRQNLVFQLRDGETAPPWLNGKTYRDVTRQYVATTDVAVKLTVEPNKPQRFAYLCVFNGGAWRAIHWGKNEDREVVFSDMGRGLRYLPAYYIDKKLVPAAPAFFLGRDGKRKSFETAGGASPISLTKAPGKLVDG